MRTDVGSTITVKSACLDKHLKEHVNDKYIYYIDIVYDDDESIEKVIGITDKRYTKYIGMGFSDTKLLCFASDYGFTFKRLNFGYMKILTDGKEIIAEFKTYIRKRNREKTFLNIEFSQCKIVFNHEGETIELFNSIRFP